MPPKDDPGMMADLDPLAIGAAIDEKSKKKGKQPTELDLQKEQRLAAKEERLKSFGKAPGGSMDAPAPAPAPIRVDPSEILDRIAAYKERFPHLKSRNKVSAKSTLEELDDELHYLELQLGGSKDGSMGTMLFVGTMVGIEKVTSSYFNPLKLNLTGLGTIAKGNVHEFQDVIDELMIKYGAGFYMAPETRLVVSVGALIFTVHCANSGDSRVGDALKKMNEAARVVPGSADL